MARFQVLTGSTPERFLEWSRTVESVEAQDLIDRTSIEFKPAIQFCYRVALRSFLSHNGYNTLPKTELQYTSQVWHRGYKRHEIQALLANLRQRHHKLFVMSEVESGLHSHVLMEVRYRHIMEDLENQTTPVAIRLEPRFHVGKKAAGCTFLVAGCLSVLRDCIEAGIVEAKPDAKLIPRSYFGIWAAIHRVGRRLELDPQIQTCHGFRKSFENALDDENIDQEKKMIIEGHFAETRAKHYTDRDIEELRDVYRRAYPFIRSSVDGPVQPRTENEACTKRLADLEARFD